MSSQTAIPVSPDLAQRFKTVEAETSQISTRYFQVKIQNEILVKAAEQQATANVSRDFNTLVSKVTETEPSYFLFRLAAQKNWLLITFVPANTPVKDKMVYAATKGTLKDKLGHQFFSGEYHCTSKEELNWDVYQGTLKPVYSLSAREEIHNRVLEDEEAERKARAAQLGSKGKATSGYHTVSIPLSDTAKKVVGSFASGHGVSFVQLAIDDRNVNSEVSNNTPISSLPSAINSSEPRFYLYKYLNKQYFIYCCPERSPQKLRMVYSTCKAHLIDACLSVGCNFSGRLEIREGSELTAESLRSASEPPPLDRLAHSNRLAGKEPETNNANIPSASVPTISSPHPVYSLMGQSPQSPKTGKKKVVIPPSGAY